MSKSKQLNLQIHSDMQVFTDLKEAWSQLWQRQPYSFFCSWEWQYCWWSCFAPLLKGQPQLHILSWQASDQRIYALLPAYTTYTNRRFSLIGLGEPANLSVYSELLDLLIDPSNNSAVINELTQYLRQFDQINLGPLEQKALLQTVSNILEENQSHKIFERAQLSGYLAQLNNSFDHYLSKLSKQTRSRIRRLMKSLDEDHYELSEAGSAEQRLLWFEELVTLHQRDWQQRGHTGAFHHPIILDFHKKLIRLSNGVRVFKLCNDSKIIGYAYGFQSSSQFEWYQAGLNHAAQKSAGFALQAALLRFFSKEPQGYCYNFLIGSNPMKQSLSLADYLVEFSELKRNTVLRQNYFKARSLVRSLVQKLRTSK